VSDDLFFPRPPSFPGDEEEIVTLDPLLERRVERSPWQVRAAQWRAWALAEAAFGAGVRTSLSGRGGHTPFRGLLTVTVPFRELDDHRYRESLFLAWVSRDPILTGVPFVFLFQPEPVPTP
jgi:hypothetical protein